MKTTVTTHLPCAGIFLNAQSEPNELIGWYFRKPINVKDIVANSKSVLINGSIYLQFQN
ncbi:MAG: hypothetical protein U0W24_26005 [Bacteroidales bacterium]